VSASLFYDGWGDKHHEFLLIIVKMILLEQIAEKRDIGKARYPVLPFLRSLGRESTQNEASFVPLYVSFPRGFIEGILVFRMWSSVLIVQGASGSVPFVPFDKGMWN